MKLLARTIITFFVFGSLLTPLHAEEENENGKRELTQEELEKNIGRMGDVDEIPEGFEFSEMENALWRSNHLENIEQPARLYYEFNKTGSYEEGFQDAVYLDILKINEDGSKNTNLQFFTEERKQTVRPSNVTEVNGNPVLGIYMQGDVYEMDRYTGGSWRHFMKKLKVAFRESSQVETIDIEYLGQKYKGKKYTVQPYLNDARRRQYEDFAEKTYEFIMSPEIPGSIYQIRTVIPGKEDTESPLVEEVLTLVEVTQS